MKTSSRSVFAPLALISTVTAPLAAETVYFLKIDGIPGEVQDVRFADHIQVVSFKLGVEQRGISDFGGGGGAGKSVFHPLKIFKFVDKASPQLFLNCATGKLIPNVTLKAAKDGQNAFLFLEVKLSDVLISGFNHESADSDGSNVLLESASLHYGRIQLTYTPQLPDGSAGTPISVSFDVKKDKRLP